MYRVEKSVINCIDVETANEARGSICQIGITQVFDGEISRNLEFQVNPECVFNPKNIQIHGITQDCVKNSPTFPELYQELRGILEGTIVVSHSWFDKSAFRMALEFYDLPPINVHWINSVDIAKTLWPESPDHKLGTVASKLNIEFQHHNALDDSRVVAELVIKSGFYEEIAEDNPVMRPIRFGWVWTGQKFRNEVDLIEFSESNVDDNELKALDLEGKHICFTGELSMSRSKANKIAVSAGCNVVKSATKNLDILVVGVQNGSLVKGKKSNKHRRAEELINAGKYIIIISETEFLNLTVEKW
ncbi:MAG: exonuclease domain-containing protein [Gammaproteobacteria bacterium]|nr:exonuclease domain-containing protein [Gammaproteobacteria bacterium]